MLKHLERGRLHDWLYWLVFGLIVRGPCPHVVVRRVARDLDALSTWLGDTEDWIVTDGATRAPWERRRARHAP